MLFCYIMKINCAFFQIGQPRHQTLRICVHRISVMATAINRDMHQKEATFSMYLPLPLDEAKRHMEELQELALFHRVRQHFSGKCAQSLFSAKVL
ncbi:hypothetical protein HGR_15029 [Hylemonella gracilis ATCC 19624]|uniref:Uncharacterized protein n=1 Tax=Hylemonella gracilis ATCC 19624 TaxID=887062 RepID=F3KX17_9BURK|nr:hypothetical protein HGR_15029 [Hylemonella gracilis ATCC 19624]